MISGGKKLIRLILESKFADDPSKIFKDKNA